MSKMTFWDAHPADYPEDYIFCADSGKYVMAVYILNDSADNPEDCDYGVFGCGYGDNTLNSKERIGDRFGPSYQREPKFTPKGKPMKAPRHKIVNGVMMYGYTKPLRYPDKLKWIIHKEPDGSTWLYKPQMLEKNACETCYGRGTKAYDVTGWSYMRIMENCNKEGFTYKEINDREKAISNRETRVIGDRMMSTNNWSIQYDGQLLFLVMANYPKMSMAEFTNVIENEGGYVDEQGFIRRGKAENKVYNPYSK